MTSTRFRYSLEAALFLYAFVLYVNSPAVVMQGQEIICDEERTNATKDDTDFCNSDVVTSKVSTWNFYYQVAYAVPALFTATMFGALSDAYGRKRVMLVSTCGSVVTNSCNLLLALYSFDLKWLYLGQVVYGLSGTYAAMLMAFFAACADISAPEERTTRVGYLEGALLVGLSVGSIVGGLVVEYVGFVAVFAICNGALVLLAIIIACMDETLPPERRAAFTLRRGNPVSVLLILFRSLPIFLLSLAFVLSLTVFIGISAVFLLYLRHVFSMSASLYGYFQASLQLFRAFGLLAVLPWLLRRYNSEPRAQAMFGAVSALAAAVQCVLWAVLQQAWWVVFVVGAIGVLTSWTVIVSRGLLSRLVRPSEQGALMGAVAVLEACIIPFAGVAVYNNTYSATVDVLPAAVFYVAAGTFLLTAVVMLWLRHCIPISIVELSPLLPDKRSLNTN